MNKVWSELNKTMQAQIKKKDTYKAGIDTLFDLRNQLMETLTLFNGELSREVKESTEKIINSLSYDELKKKISEERKERLKILNVVSNDENAIWLIDYWCSKNIRGLIQMPFSRHWIMHIEASLRIKNKIHS